MSKSENMNKSENKIRELTETDLNTVVGGSTQIPTGKAAGNVSGGWNLVNNKVHS